MPNPFDIHPPGWWEPDYDYDEDPYPEDDEDESVFDCGYIRGEGCIEAGTEECDFECPYRDVLYGRVDSSPVPTVVAEEDIPF